MKVFQSLLYLAVFISIGNGEFQLLRNFFPNQTDTDVIRETHKYLEAIICTNASSFEFFHYAIDIQCPMRYSNTTLNEVNNLIHFINETTWNDAIANFISNHLEASYLNGSYFTQYGLQNVANLFNVFESIFNYIEQSTESIRNSISISYGRPGSVESNTYLNVRHPRFAESYLELINEYISYQRETMTLYNITDDIRIPSFFLLGSFFNENSFDPVNTRNVDSWLNQTNVDRFNSYMHTQLILNNIARFNILSRYHNISIYDSILNDKRTTMATCRLLKEGNYFNFVSMQSVNFGISIGSLSRIVCLITGVVTFYLSFGAGGNY